MPFHESLCIRAWPSAVPFVRLFSLCHPERSESGREATGLTQSRDLPFVGPSYTVREKQVPRLGLKSSLGMTILGRDTNLSGPRGERCCRLAGYVTECPTSHHHVTRITSPWAVAGQESNHRSVRGEPPSRNGFQVGWRIVRCHQVPSDGPANRKGSNGQGPRFGADRSRAL